jgi:hypothetical protein
MSQSPTEVLDRMFGAYFFCRSYRGEGTSTLSIPDHGISVVRHFSLLFNRHVGFRYELRSPRRDGSSTLHVLWLDKGTLREHRSATSTSQDEPASPVVPGTTSQPPAGLEMTIIDFLLLPRIISEGHPFSEIYRSSRVRSEPPIGPAHCDILHAPGPDSTFQEIWIHRQTSTLILERKEEIFRPKPETADEILRRTPQDLASRPDVIELATKLSQTSGQPIRYRAVTKHTATLNIDIDESELKFEAPPET